MPIWRSRAHIEHVREKLLLQRLFRHYAGVRHKNAMAWDTQSEGHVPKVRHVLSCEMLKIPAILGLQGKPQACEHCSREGLTIQG